MTPKPVPRADTTLFTGQTESKHNNQFLHYSRIFTHTFKRSLYKSEKRLEILALPEIEDDWTDAFKDLGIFQDVKGSIASFGAGNGGDSSKKKGWRGIFSKSKASATNHTDVRAIGSIA